MYIVCHVVLIIFFVILRQPEQMEMFDFYKCTLRRFDMFEYIDRIEMKQSAHDEEIDEDEIEMSCTKSLSEHFKDMFVQDELNL
jgi:hypothetical protein